VKKYIVKSGDSYVSDVETLEMISNRKSHSDAAMRAHRMSLKEAAGVLDRMARNGLSSELVEVRVGKAREEVKVFDEF